MSKRYTVQIELDENGEECLPFPDELVAELGWQVGDTICWQPEGDGWVLTKKKEENEIEYEQEDLDRARELYAKGYVINEATEDNIIDCAKAYYHLRINSWEYTHKDIK